MACAMLCLTVLGCRKDSHPNTPVEPEPEELYPISMTASSTDMSNSRALVTNTEELQDTHLGVYAIKELADETQPLVFENVELEYSGGWTYSPLRYWDRTAHYYFVAYSPYSSSDVSYNDESHHLTISNIPNWQTINADAKDYIVANDNGAAEGKYITEKGVQPVPLNFKHILSQLEVRIVKNAFLISKYTLNKVSYTHVPIKGTQTEAATSSYQHPNINEGTPSWITGDNFISTSAIEMSSPNATITNSPTEHTTLRHLVVPFKLEEEQTVQITIEYSINDTKQEAKTVTTSLNELIASQHYVLTLTFESGTNITPSLSIEPWAETEVDEDKYNW